MTKDGQNYFMTNLHPAREDGGTCNGVTDYTAGSTSTCPLADSWGISPPTAATEATGWSAAIYQLPFLDTAFAVFTTPAKTINVALADWASLSGAINVSPNPALGEVKGSLFYPGTLQVTDIVDLANEARIMGRSLTADLVCNSLTNQGTLTMGQMSNGAIVRSYSTFTAGELTATTDASKFSVIPVVQTGLLTDNLDIHGDSSEVETGTGLECGVGWSKNLAAPLEPLAVDSAFLTDIGTDTYTGRVIWSAREDGSAGENVHLSVVGNTTQINMPAANVTIAPGAVTVTSSSGAVATKLLPCMGEPANNATKLLQMAAGRTQQWNAYLGGYQPLRLMTGDNRFFPTQANGNLQIWDGSDDGADIDCGHSVSYADAYALGIMFFEGLSSAASLRLKSHTHLEARPLPGSSWASFAHPSPLIDERALQLIAACSQTMPTGFVAADNDLGGMVGKLGAAASSLLGGLDGGLLKDGGQLLGGLLSSLGV